MANAGQDTNVNLHYFQIQLWTNLNLGVTILYYYCTYTMAWWEVC